MLNDDNIFTKSNVSELFDFLLNTKSRLRSFELCVNMADLF